ncbi:E3 ubiquitin-protein ligase MIB2 [Lamellibrachia satsuma]|nr:E3 ubiquitin-protein ligase MIB2 [Lamellibrachia satsuma]
MEVGIRVVRGPDWKWHNQDGGEGHTGTVVEIGKSGNNNTPSKTVVIQWDSGFRTNYRVGYQGAYDLRVFDNGPVGVKHPNTVCSGCKKKGLQGLRWKCAKCRDYDLCQRCYMADIHDVQHTFLRFDSSIAPGVKVPRRSTSKKIESSGIFPRAKVVRGANWDWGNQDGGEGKQGTVQEIRGWDNESGHSVAHVTWASGVTNVYRLGHKGKVDLKYVEEASGGSYYPEHLPILGHIAEVSSVTNIHPMFKVGDIVKVDLDIGILKQMQEGHGGWNPRMAEYSGQIGKVHRITERGDVRVQYEGCSNRWTFHAGSLTKVVDEFAVGDEVQVCDSLATVQELQKDHGEWTETMRNALGRKAKVTKVYSNRDLQLSMDNFQWTFNPACCTRLRQTSHSKHNTMSRDQRVSNTKDTLMEQLTSALHSPSAEPVQLLQEAAKGNADFVRAMLARHPEQVDQRSRGKTALQVACHQGHVNVVSLLLTNGANVNLADDDGDTPLHYSVFGNQPEVSEMLLNHGAMVDALNKGQCSSLHVAVNKQHPHCVDILLRHRCNTNLQDCYGDTAMHDAVSKESRDIVGKLSACPRTDFLLKNKKGFNVLHYAVLKGNHLAVAEILQRAGQLVDMKKDDGFAALHLAALNGHFDVTQTLMGKADLEVKNNRHQTALLLAASQGHTELIELLVANNADVNAWNEDGDTTLHVVLSRSLRDNLSRAPIIAEIKSKQTKARIKSTSSFAAACFLVERGASLQIKNHAGHMPLNLVTDPAAVDILNHHAREFVESDSPECSVCSETRANVTFKPCMHKVVCAQCSQRMKKCLICKTSIKTKIGPGGVPVVERQLSSELQVKELERKVQELEESQICSICLEHQRSIIFLCGHGACAKCAKSLKICHMCRMPISNKINVFN